MLRRTWSPEPHLVRQGGLRSHGRRVEQQPNADCGQRLCGIKAGLCGIKAGPIALVSKAIGRPSERKGLRENAGRIAGVQDVADIGGRCWRQSGVGVLLIITAERIAAPNRTSDRQQGRARSDAIRWHGHASRTRFDGNVAVRWQLSLRSDAVSSSDDDCPGGCFPAGGQCAPWRRCPQPVLSLRSPRRAEIFPEKRGLRPRETSCLPGPDRCGGHGGAAARVLTTWEAPRRPDSHMEGRHP